MISKDDKKNFETIFALPDFQPVIRRKNKPKDPLVLEKPEILPPMRKRPRLNYANLNYGVINDEDFNEEECLIQTDISTNDIQNQTDKKPRIPSSTEPIVEEMKVAKNKSLSIIPEIFKCNICEYETPKNYLLKKHLESDHEVFKPLKKKDYICPICEYHSPDMNRIHVHIDSNHPEHDEKKIVCNHCPRSFIFEASLKKHLENQRTMAKNRAKKINLGLMQRNRRKKYEDHNLNQPDNPTNDIQTKTIETGTYNLINRPSGSCISLILCCKSIRSFACFYCKMPMFWRAGMREEEKPLPLTFQYLIFMR